MNAVTVATPSLDGISNSLEAVLLSVKTAFTGTQAEERTLQILI